MSNFIDSGEIENVLNRNRNPSRQQIKEILTKTSQLECLTLDDAAALLQAEEESDDLYQAAGAVKERVYGNRVVLFAPLYLGNACVNNCLYCGFRSENHAMKRLVLNPALLRKEVRALQAQGHKRLLLVAGEHASEPLFMNYLEEAIQTVYEGKNESGAIRRINVNVAPLSTDGFRRLKSTGIGTYQLFQETYHRPTYGRVHVSGPKADFDYRLQTMDRAQEAGIGDVGIGVLFGLYDYKFEVLALLMHASHLQQRFGAGPHTISMPRLRLAQGASFTGQDGCQVSDDQFRRVVAVLRVAVPYTGLILSTREAASFRDELLSLGISQISAGSRTSPGGYAEHTEEERPDGQFALEDSRPQLQVVKEMLKTGFFPSFCTSCYRTGRTGERFMELARPGEIKHLCIPNSVLTFKEYILDYGDAELQRTAQPALEKAITQIRDEEMRRTVREEMARMEKGERDLYV